MRDLMVIALSGGCAVLIIFAIGAMQLAGRSDAHLRNPREGERL